ncbi:hypothetical protein A6A25_11960 [Saccharothrix sp. CB00851]|nr:hypothetical protein A6A25_11960 [Saccharothrix sp. CB00851]
MRRHGRWHVVPTRTTPGRRSRLVPTGTASSRWFRWRQLAVDGLDRNVIATRTTPGWLDLGQLAVHRLDRRHVIATRPSPGGRLLLRQLAVDRLDRNVVTARATPGRRGRLDLVPPGTTAGGRLDRRRQVVPAGTAAGRGRLGVGRAGLPRTAETSGRCRGPLGVAGTADGLVEATRRRRRAVEATGGRGRPVRRDRAVETARRGRWPGETAWWRGWAVTEVRWFAVDVGRLGPGSWRSARRAALRRGRVVAHRKTSQAERSRTTRCFRDLLGYVNVFIQQWT